MNTRFAGFLLSERDLTLNVDFAPIFPVLMAPKWHHVT
jgi:hypothetical protein